MNNTGADETSVSQALTRVQQARIEADNERIKTAAGPDEAVTAAAIAGADKEDRAVEKTQFGPAYDSPERRLQLAESLDDKVNCEAVNSRLLADKYQGAPATAAVCQGPSLAKTSKIATQAGRGKSLQRGGLEL